MAYSGLLGPPPRSCIRVCTLSRKHLHYTTLWPSGKSLPPGAPAMPSPDPIACICLPLLELIRQTQAGSVVQAFRR